MSSVRSVGVEEELLLVDPARATAAPLGEQVVGDAAAGRPEPPVEHEFKQEQVEIASKPQQDLQQLLADLRAQRAVADAAARERGIRIAGLGTHPGKLRTRGTEDPRYHRMVAEFGLLAAEQLTCGQHIHVQIGSRAEGVQALNRIRGWLAVLLALSTNSPFWQEQDTGYASYRSVLWGRWPSAGPTELYPDEAAYQAAIQAQLAAGSALDDGMIYFDARLSARYPTVEIRVADVSSDVRTAALLAALARGLVEQAARSHDRPPLAVSVPVLRAASWRAARFGLTGTLLDPRTGQQQPAWTVVEVLLEQLSPALAAAGDLSFVTEQLQRIRPRHRCTPAARGAGRDR